MTILSHSTRLNPQKLPLLDPATLPKITYLETLVNPRQIHSNPEQIWMKLGSLGELVNDVWLLQTIRAGIFLSGNYHRIRSPMLSTEAREHFPRIRLRGDVKDEELKNDRQKDKQ